jgi:hypothetical protein
MNTGSFGVSRWLDIALKLSGQTLIGVITISDELTNLVGRGCDGTRWPGNLHERHGLKALGITLIHTNPGSEATCPIRAVRKNSTVGSTPRTVQVRGDSLIAGNQEDQDPTDGHKRGDGGRHPPPQTPPPTHGFGAQGLPGHLTPLQRVSHERILVAR